MKLSDNLKRIRKENNLSQEQLAEKLGVSRQAVSKWEAGQSYPEMDKVLLLCKLFHYSMDELMNENVKEVNETKQSKSNLNKYVEDFFQFITKTVQMFSCMKWRQKIGCIVEQAIVAICLLILFVIIGAIGGSILESLFRGHYYSIRHIFEALYTLFAFILGVTVLLHIFKIRYLDYYEFVKENDQAEPCHTLEENKQKIVLEQKKEKVIIRDPEHTGSKFLTGMFKGILWCVKALVALVSINFVFSFVLFTALLIISLTFIQAGMVFWGTFLGIVAALILNFLILEGIYHFLISKKNKKGRMAILFIASLALAGIGIGLISIGITQFNYVEKPENTIEDVYTLPMTDKLYIRNINAAMQYVETDTDEIKLEVKHAEYYKTEIYQYTDEVTIYCISNESKIMEHLRRIIADIQHKEIRNYYEPEIYVYTSSKNIEALKQNKNKRHIYDAKEFTILELTENP